MFNFKLSSVRPRPKGFIQYAYVFYIGLAARGIATVRRPGSFRSIQNVETGRFDSQKTTGPGAARADETRRMCVSAVEVTGTQGTGLHPPTDKAPAPEILGTGIVTFGADDCLAVKQRDSDE